MALLFYYKASVDMIPPETISYDQFMTALSELKATDEASIYTKLCAALTAAKRSGEATLPTYSRELSDPVPGGVQLKKTHRCVLVEGNYLLLRDDPRWSPLAPLWDETWFVRCETAEARAEKLKALALQ